MTQERKFVFFFRWLGSAIPGVSDLGLRAADWSARDMEGTPAPAESTVLAFASDSSQTEDWGQWGGGEVSVNSAVTQCDGAGSLLSLRSVLVRAWDSNKHEWRAPESQ